MPFQPFEEIQRGVELEPYADRFRRDFGKILWRRGDAVVAGLVVVEFLFTEIGIIGRGHLGHGLADADLTLEFDRISGRLAHEFYRNGQFVAEALRGAGQGLTVDRKVGDEAILTIGAFLGRVTNIEHRGGDGLALAGFLEDDVGIAVHQPVD